MGKKRHRTTSHAEAALTNPKKKLKTSNKSTTFDRYEEQLGDKSQTVRIRAAADLLEWLRQEQAVDVAVVEDVLSRLTRALSQPTTVEKEGYFIALTELLRQLYGEKRAFESNKVPKLGKIISTLDDQTYEQFNPKNRKSLNGRISCLKALVQSSAITMTLERVELIKSLLLKTLRLAGQQPWIQQECGMLLSDLTKSSSSLLADHTRSQQHQQVFIGMIVSADFLTTMKKTKTIEGLWANASDSVINQMVSIISSQLRKPGNRGEPNSFREQLTDILVSLVRIREIRTTESEGWLKVVLGTLQELAYFKQAESLREVDTIGPPLTEKDRRMIQTRLSSILAHLASSKAEKATLWPSFVANRIRKTAEASKTLELIVQPEGPLQSTIEQTYKTLHSLDEDIEKAPNSVIAAFQLLFSLALLQAYGGDADAIQVLEELEQSHADVKSGAESHGEAVDAIIDLILGYFSKGTAMTKSLGKQAFMTIAADLSEEALQPLYDILVKKESKKGLEELFDEDNTGEEEDTDVEDASDVGVINGVEAEDSNNASSEDDESSEFGSDIEAISQPGEDSSTDEDEDGSDEASDGDAELARFDDLLAQTLRTSKPTANGKSKTADESSETDHESDMDSDAMIAIDEQLSAAFRQRRAILSQSSTKKKKSDDKRARETVVNFKARVLDLLTAYVKQEYANPAALSVILPLLKTMRLTSAPHVANSARKVLTSLFDTCGRHKSYPKPGGRDKALELLHQIHEEANQLASNAHGAACSRSSLFVAKLLLNEDRAAYDDVLKVFAETQKKWFEAGSEARIHPSFFTDWINWSNEMRKTKKA